MQLAKTLKKDLLELARSHGLDVTARMTKQQIMDVYHSKARKKELFDLARLLGHKVTARSTKQQLLNICVPKVQAVKPSASAIKPKGADAAPATLRQADTLKAPMPSEPEINLPWRYDENRLVLMPVNPHKVYGYWEVTSEVCAMGQNYRVCDYKLVLKLLAVSETGKSRVIQTVEIEPFGEYYFVQNLAGQTVWLELGLKDQRNNQEIPVLHSLRTQMPTDHVSDSTEELYLTVLENGAGKPTLVFSGQNSDAERAGDEIFFADFESFPRFGY